MSKILTKYLKDEFKGSLKNTFICSVLGKDIANKINKADLSSWDIGLISLPQKKCVIDLILDSDEGHTVFEMEEIGFGGFLATTYYEHLSGITKATLLMKRVDGNSSSTKLVSVVLNGESIPPKQVYTSEEQAPLLRDNVYNVLWGIELLLNNRSFRQGVEKRHFFRSSKKNNKKQVYTDYNYIYLREKSKTINYSKRDIEWETSWKVRGHWRALKKGQFGKNRSGEVTNESRTWIKPYLKNINKKFVNKIQRIKC